jgi:hypothetical protein
MKTLRAGPVTMLLEEASGGVRRLSVAGHETVRRIYPTVRDREWNTVPLKIWNLQVQESGDAFRVDYLGRCQQGEIDFAWKGSITGDARGTVVVRMEGQARSAFLRNRIGLCVLHPLRACAGQPATVETPDGGQRRGTFPRYIWPKPPFTRFVKLWHAPAPGLRVRLDFSGDVFEMEDQRNWTDASFKTYPTPVDLPRPAETPRGMLVEQSVTVALEEAAPAPRPAPEPLLQIDTRPGRPLPRVGFGAARTGFALRPREIERLRALRPAHVRVDIQPGATGWEDAFRRGRDEARALGCGLELALHLGEAELLPPLLAEARATIARVLLFQDGAPVVLPARLRAVKEVLAPKLPGVPIGGGSDTHFEALNTGPAPKEWDAACWPATPQVHMHDDLTLVENLEGIAATLESAKLFCGERPLAVTPITLLPRAGPGAPGERGTAPPVDARQWTLLGAAWTVGALKQLALGGAASATFYETAGACGLLDRGPRPVYPLYHVFADLAELSDGRVVGCASSDPLAFDGLAVAHGGRTRILLAHLTEERRRVAVARLPAAVTLKRLNAASLEQACARPEEWRAGPGEVVDVSAGRLELDLEPWEVVRIDA